MMNLEEVKPIVDALLYEGYILYPYRPSSAKNRQRWTFGGIYPRVYAKATGGAEPCQMQTECLVEGDRDTRLQVRVRFLHPVAREIGELPEPLERWPDDRVPAFRIVRSLDLGDRQVYSWQEAMEQDVVVADCRLGELIDEGRAPAFAFSGWRKLDPLRDDSGCIRGVLMRTRYGVEGRIHLVVDAVGAAYRLFVRIENLTPMEPATVTSREEASLYSFASTHTILGAEGGAFASLMDPPDALRQAASACNNQGTFPVLVGRPGSRNTVLSSPIILYDYPEVAPESPGDLFDATEIDELLSLNILAMTDTEKREMVAADPRAAELLARTEALDGDALMRLHGTLREPRPAAPPSPHERCSGGPRLAYCRDGTSALKVGDRVRLRPGSGGDIMDLALAGRTAVIESIERDYEDRIHVAVTLDDDPGREWGLQRMPGHRFFFSPEEFERLEQTPEREKWA